MRLVPLLFLLQTGGGGVGVDTRLGAMSELRGSEHAKPSAHTWPGGRLATRRMSQVNPCY